MTPEELAEDIAAAQDLVDAKKHALENPPSSNDVVFPEIFVPLTGEDGNAFFILGRVSSAMKAAGVEEPMRKVFHEQATSGDYDHLLRTVMEWVNTA